MIHPTLDNAKGKWKDLLERIGVDAKFLTGKHTACPMCGPGKHEHRFRFDDKDGNGCWICTQCGSGTGYQLIKALFPWNDKEVFRRIDSLIGYCEKMPTKPEPDPERVREYLIAVWKGSYPIDAMDNPARAYLLRRSGRNGVDFSSLRYHPNLKHSISNAYHPALLCGMRKMDSKVYCGIQRIYLTMDGCKADVDPVKMTYGEVAPVELGEPEMGALGVAEGVETALAASKHFRIPVWAAMGADGLKKFVPPSFVNYLIIFSDNDENFTGQAAAYHLANKMALKGIKVKIEVPAETGTDWCDVANRSRS